MIVTSPLLKKPLHYLILLIIIAPSYAGIYKWVDENGKVHFSDTKPNILAVQNIKLQINSYTSVAISESNLGNNLGKVVMYSAEWCGYCKTAKKYFKKQRISFTEYDIEKSKKGIRDYKKLAGTGVPIILVGKKRMNGFSESGFKKIYN